MKKVKPIILIITSLISLAIIFAVSLHSVEEIHYLKSFYPSTFTVEAAFYASAVELIKVIIISLPFFVMIIVSLCWLIYLLKKD
jgi:hypothetical protein